MLVYHYFPPRHLPHRTNKLLNFLIELFCDSLTRIDFGQGILRISFAEPCTACGVGLTLQDAIRARQSTHARIHQAVTTQRVAAHKVIRPYSRCDSEACEKLSAECTIIFFAR